MVDATVGPDRIETRADLDPGDVGLYEFWMGMERIAEKDERKWVKRAREVVKRYRDERPESLGNVHRYNILWSNVQTLKPTLYGRTPKPDVERRFKDQDDVGRLASELLQRAISYTFDQTDFDRLMSACVEDKLLPGRGTARVLYIPHFGEVLNGEGENAEFEETEDAPSLIDSEGDEGSEASDGGGNSGGEQGGAAGIGGQGTPEAQSLSATPLREVVYEEVRLDYVFWEDYREGPARTWREVPWVRYRAYMTRDELVARFGAKGKKVNLDYTPQGGTPLSKEDQPPDIYKKAVVHEYWDKVKMEVVWLAPGTDDIILDRVDDPLKLPDFFPSPDPLLSTTTNNTRIPVPDYLEYQDQARELDTLTARIDKLQRALKISGVYPGENKQVLQQLVDEGTENRLIPVEDWAMWADKGGMKEFIQWFPVEQIAQVLIQLYEARDKIKATLYEITGIGDIMRGNTLPNETATAQMLKTNFVTRRVQPQQKEVARFARDLVRLTGAVVAEHFSAKTISMITGYPKLQPVPQVPPRPIMPMAPQALPAPAPQGNVVPMHPAQPQAPQPPSPQMIAYQQQMAAWQQANAKAQQIIAANQQAQAQFDAAVELIKQDGVHGFRIDIEADSTVAPDEEAEKAARTDFLAKFVPLMEQTAMFAQGNPPMATLAKEVVLFGVRGFRVARPLEEAIENAFDALAQMPPNPNGPMGQKGKGAPQQNPQIEAAKVQADVQDTQTKAQTDRMAIIQKQQQADQQMQLEATRTALQSQNEQQERMLQAAELEQRERLESLRAQSIEQRMTKSMV